MLTEGRFLGQNVDPSGQDLHSLVGARLGLFQAPTRNHERVWKFLLGGWMSSLSSVPTSTSTAIICQNVTITAITACRHVGCYKDVNALDIVGWKLCILSSYETPSQCLVRYLLPTFKRLGSPSRYTRPSPLSPQPSGTINSRLPLELCEHIIDARYQEPSCRDWFTPRILYRTWLSTALVCFDWLPRTRFNLFRHVRVDSSSDCNLFLRTLSSSPHLATLVIRVDIGYHEHQSCTLYARLLDPQLLTNRVHVYIPPLTGVPAFFTSIC